ncbi:MAG: transcriptional regulator, family [Thermosipho sp. (in: Bacteria)]|nr:transcriptional regulator, family [Thermosipho sp. (in: thermotogales)]
MTIGDKIRLLRTQKKISIRKLAEITGLSKSTLSDIENNKSKKPTIDTISKIAKALEISISELFEETNLQTKENIQQITKEKESESKNHSEVFLRSVARAKERPKEVQERIAAFIDLILEQEDN